MTTAERGKARAQGALANFLSDLQREMQNRPPDYVASFWANLRGEMCDYLNEKDFS